MKLYDPKWDKLKMGTVTSPIVAPGSYNQNKVPKKIKVHKFSTTKTNRLGVDRNDGPSPNKYDTVTGMSMCSSQAYFKSLPR